jgi:hypothetical protein
MHRPQRDLHQQLRAEAIATRERLAAVLRPLDQSKLNEHPEPTGWSVSQVLEHLCVADELYEAPLAALMRSAPQDAGAPTREWKPSFIGGLIAGGLLKPKPLTSPQPLAQGAELKGELHWEVLASRGSSPLLCLVPPNVPEECFRGHLRNRRNPGRPWISRGAGVIPSERSESRNRDHAGSGAGLSFGTTQDSSLRSE